MNNSQTSRTPSFISSFVSRFRNFKIFDGKRKRSPSLPPSNKQDSNSYLSFVKPLSKKPRKHSPSIATARKSSRERINSPHVADKSPLETTIIQSPLISTFGKSSKVRIDSIGEFRESNGKRRKTTPPPDEQEFKKIKPLTQNTPIARKSNGISLVSPSNQRIADESPPEMTTTESTIKRKKTTTPKQSVAIKSPPKTAIIQPSTPNATESTIKRKKPATPQSDKQDVINSIKPRPKTIRIQSPPSTPNVPANKQQDESSFEKITYIKKLSVADTLHDFKDVQRNKFISSFLKTQKNYDISNKNRSIEQECENLYNKKFKLPLPKIIDYNDINNNPRAIHDNRFVCSFQNLRNKEDRTFLGNVIYQNANDKTIDIVSDYTIIPKDIICNIEIENTKGKFIISQSTEIDRLKQYDENQPCTKKIYVDIYLTKDDGFLFELDSVRVSHTDKKGQLQYTINKFDINSSIVISGAIGSKNEKELHKIYGKYKTLFKSLIKELDISQPLSNVIDDITELIRIKYGLDYKKFEKDNEIYKQEYVNCLLDIKRLGDILQVKTAQVLNKPFISNDRIAIVMAASLGCKCIRTEKINLDKSENSIQKSANLWFYNFDKDKILTSDILQYQQEAKNSIITLTRNFCAFVTQNYQKAIIKDDLNRYIKNLLDEIKQIDSDSKIMIFQHKIPKTHIKEHLELKLAFVVSYLLYNILYNFDNTDDNILYNLGSFLSIENELNQNYILHILNNFKDNDMLNDISSFEKILQNVRKVFFNDNTINFIQQYINYINDIFEYSEYYNGDFKLKPKKYKAITIQVAEYSDIVNELSFYYNKYVKEPILYLNIYRELFDYFEDKDDLTTTSVFDIVYRNNNKREIKKGHNASRVEKNDSSDDDENDDDELDSEDRQAIKRKKDKDLNSTRKKEKKEEDDDETFGGKSAIINDMSLPLVENSFIEKNMKTFVAKTSDSAFTSDPLQAYHTNTTTKSRFYENLNKCKFSTVKDDNYLAQFLISFVTESHGFFDDNGNITQNYIKFIEN